MTVVVSDAGKGALDASGGDQEDVCRSRWRGVHLFDGYEYLL